MYFWTQFKVLVLTDKALRCYLMTRLPEGHLALYLYWPAFILRSASDALLVCLSVEQARLVGTRGASFVVVPQIRNSLREVDDLFSVQASKKSFEGPPYSCGFSLKILWLCRPPG